jgi:hypothetical protein
MNLNGLSRKTKVIVSALGVIAFVIGFYVSVFNSFGYQSNNEAIGLTCMLLSLLVYPILWPDLLLKIQWKASVLMKTLVITGGGMVLVISFVFMIYYLRENYLQSELNKHGIQTTAIVTGFEYESRRSGKVEYATIQYASGNKTITQRVTNYSGTYHINQKLSIYYSRNNPEMFEVIGQ